MNPLARPLNPRDLNGSDVGHHGAIGFVMFDDVDQLMTIGVQQISKHLGVVLWRKRRAWRIGPQDGYVVNLPMVIV